MHTIRGASAPLIGAAAASTLVTAAVALPMGVEAIRASNDPAGLHDAVAMNDDRFPAAVPLGEAEIATLTETGDEPRDQIAAPPSTAPPATAESALPTSTGTPEPSTSPTSTETAQPPGGNDSEELAAVFPTPTTERPPTPIPSPLPSATPVPPTPTPLVPTPNPEPRPTEPPPESRSDDEDDGTVEAAPTRVPEPLLESEPAPSTDVYAFVNGPLLTQHEVGTVYVKAMNAGQETTTGLVIDIVVSGGTVMSVVSADAEWACSGGGSRWACVGPRLPPQAIAKTVITLVPDREELVVSASVSHELVDVAPANNSLDAQVMVIPDDGESEPPIDDDATAGQGTTEQPGRGNRPGG